MPGEWIGWVEEEEGGDLDQLTTLYQVVSLLPSLSTDQIIFRSLKPLASSKILYLMMI